MYKDGSKLAYDTVAKKLVIDDTYGIPSRRTISQNYFYWGMLREIAGQTGIRAEDLHESFKQLFLPPWGVDSTRELTPEGFGGYLFNIAEWVKREWNVRLSRDVTRPVEPEACCA